MIKVFFSVSSGGCVTASLLDQIRQRYELLEVVGFYEASGKYSICFRGRPLSPNLASAANQLWFAEATQNGARASLSIQAGKMPKLAAGQRQPVARWKTVQNKDRRPSPSVMEYEHVG